ncbi:MAG: RNA polymerase sigma factor [Clostridia bacterium]|nr:RNA polymerase sigma factor [Clostridia bacterium]
MTLAGDQDAYGELVLRWQSAALAQANSVLQSVYLSEDAAQDAFVAAWLKLNTLSDPSKFGAWVCKAAKNRAKNILVRYSGWMDFSAYENTAADDTFSPTVALIGTSEKEELHNAIKSLPEKVRTVITLHYFEGLSVAEIADKMRISVGTAKWHLSDGRKRLRGELMATNEDYNDTLTERVMKKVEELKLWSSKTDKTGFELVYKDVLTDVEDLPESEKKYHAMADVLLRGFWWLPGKKNDSLVVRIADAAEKGHNDEATAFICSKEDAKLSGEAKIEFILDKQIPRLTGEDLPIALGSEWLALANAYLETEQHEKGLQALKKAREILPKNSVQYASIFYAEDLVELRDTKYKEKDKYKFRVYSSGYEISLKNGYPLKTNEQFFNYKGEWTPAVGGWYRILANASCCDGIFFTEGADVGYVKTASDKTTLTLLSKTETVDTPAGIFEDCELWETLPADSYISEVYRAYYKRGVGMVKFCEIINDEVETVVLSSYNVKKSDSLMPLDKDNTWEYTRQSEYPSVYHDVKIKVVFKSDEKVTLAVFSETERLYYDEHSFADMAYAVRSEYYDFEEKIIDVRDYIKKLSAAAKTKLQKAHAKVASSVMDRLMDENGITENDQYENTWNFFEYKTFSQRNGNVVCQENRDFAFEWKCVRGTVYDDQVLFNYIYDFLSDNFGCVYSDQWVPGFRTVKELYDYNDDSVKTELICEDAGKVKVACGEFDDCLRVTIDTTGKLEYHEYYGGKKTYIFAKGVGIIRSENYYAENALCAVYELTEYEGTGEGYFPLDDGLHRHYDLINPKRNYVGYTDYTFVKDNYGRTVVFSDKRGSRKKAELLEYYKTKDEKEVGELWDKRDFDEYYIRQGLVNLKIQIHALFEANPTNWFDACLPAAHNQFSMRVIESFGEGGVPEIWYGAYARKSLIAAAVLFACGKTEKGRQYMETAFTYYEKWNAIPKVTKLPVGAPWLFGNVTAEKGSGILTLSNGSKEVLDIVIFRERPMSEISAALNSWGWFDSVRKEPFFAEYIKRAEEYKD